MFVAASGIVKISVLNFESTEVFLGRYFFLFPSYIWGVFTIYPFARIFSGETYYTLIKLVLEFTFYKLWPLKELKDESMALGDWVFSLFESVVDNLKLARNVSKFYYSF